MMDVEPLSIDFPPSAREFLEQCTVTHQDGLAENDREPTVSNTPDSETKTSSAISLPVESQQLVVTGVNGTAGENYFMGDLVHDSPASTGSIIHYGDSGVAVSNG
ncbi:hypothetical protein CFP56_036144 [Quercus suber]|uniref:Uncharacterized protein n=1 Tax=Quercus suber TaxID=58331 RepID=A0AAW0LPJ4_QUESU